MIYVLPAVAALWLLTGVGRSLWRIAVALEKVVAMYEHAGHGVPDEPQ